MKKIILSLVFALVLTNLCYADGMPEMFFDQERFDKEVPVVKVVKRKSSYNVLKEKYQKEQEKNIGLKKIINEANSEIETLSTELFYCTQEVRQKEAVIQDLTDEVNIIDKLTRDQEEKNCWPMAICSALLFFFIGTNF